jgi:hypothetical protein
LDTTMSKSNSSRQLEKLLRAVATQK